MANIMTSADNLNYEMENTLSRSQDLDTYPDVTKFDPEEMELCCTSTPKHVIKCDSEASAKFPKIQSIIYDRD